jgi:hypothetical protein
LDKAKAGSNSHIMRSRRRHGIQIGRDLRVRVMADHLKIDFEALASGLADAFQDILKARPRELEKSHYSG